MLWQEVLGTKVQRGVISSNRATCKSAPGASPTSAVCLRCLPPSTVVTTSLQSGGLPLGGGGDGGDGNRGDDGLSALLILAVVRP